HKARGPLGIALRLAPAQHDRDLAGLQDAQHDVQQHGGYAPLGHAALQLAGEVRELTHEVAHELLLALQQAELTAHEDDLALEPSRLALERVADALTRPQPMLQRDDEPREAHEQGESGAAEDLHDSHAPRISKRRACGAAPIRR